MMICRISEWGGKVMDSIKFRYVCRNIHFNEIKLVYLSSDQAIFKEGRGRLPSWILTDNCEILGRQLFTGVSDIDGKDIYEGDTIAIVSRLRIGVPADTRGVFVVEWNPSGFNLSRFGNYEIVDTPYSAPDCEMCPRGSN
jgi:hypothetical protein